MVELLGIVIAVAVLRARLRADRPAWTASDVRAATSSAWSWRSLVFAYLLYVLFRGEKL